MIQNCLQERGIQPMKKFITAILLVTLISGMFVPAFATSDNATYNAEYALATQIFTQYGVLDKLPESGAVTRGEFASALYILLGYDGITANNVYYEDTIGLNEVNVLAQTGVFTNGGTRFSPSENITFSEAVSWLMNATGWGIKAQAKGGKFAQYAKLANQCDLFRIFDKNSFSENTELDTASVIKLFYDAANAKLFSADAISNGEASYSTKSNDTIFTLVFDACYIEGKVTADKYTAMYVNSQACDKGYIRINKKDLKYGGDDYDTLIGTNVKAFYNDDSDDIIALVCDEDENQAIKLEAGDIISFANHNLKYSDENGKTKSIKMSADTALIYNNSAVAGNFDGVLKNLKCAFVTVYRNADSGKYDVIVVDEYINAQIKDVEAAYEVVYTDSKVMPKVEIGNYEYSKFLSADGGSKVFLAGIFPNDGVSIKASKNGSIIVMYFSKKTVSGVVEGVSKKNGVTTVTIDGKAYNIARDRDFASDVKIGNVYTFITNLFDELISIKIASGENNSMLGYIYGYSETNGLSSDVSVKVFTQEGVHGAYKLADKVTVDGSRMNASEAKSKLFDDTGKFKRTLIRFSVNNDDEIALIDTPASTQEEREGEGTLWEVSPLASLKYNHREDVFKPNLIVAKNYTYVFIVPSDKTLTDENRFGVMLYGGYTYPFGWSGNYNVAGYKYDTLYKPLEAVIWEFNADSQYDGKRLMVIDKVEQKGDDNGVYTAVSGMAEGIYTTVSTYDASLVSGIGEGDTVVYTTVPGNSNIATIAKVLDYDPDTKTVTQAWGSDFEGTVHNTKGNFGYVRKFQRNVNGAKESYMRIGNGENEIQFSFDESKAPLVIYDDGEFILNDYSTIKSSEHTGVDTDGDYIYVCGYYPYITYTIVYKSQE